MIQDIRISSIFQTSRATVDDIEKVIMKSPAKSCILDSIPTYLLKECKSELSTTITNIVNLSLSSGKMPDDFKHAVITPLLKKPGAKLIYKNYRPVSGLPFVSKLIEKVVSKQLNQHVDANQLNETYQSAYKSKHSTETALIKITNDLLLEADNQHVVFLDLSAAFDTVDHDMLLSRLETMFGINGLALQWFETYLTGRTQSVKINSEMSEKKTLKCCVPQGSVLGPPLYCDYTIPLGIIIRLFLILFHMYADDSQLYKSISSTCEEDQQQGIRQLEECICEISDWMKKNKLKINEEKTEFLIVGTSQQRSKMQFDSISVGGLKIKSSPVVKNLGVYLDEELTMETHIRHICNSCYHFLGNIRLIRRYLTVSSAKTIVHSVISSRIDYCNSLFIGISEYLIKKLQLVQNYAARIVLNLKKFDSITPALIKLHWLPVKQRIVYKVNLLVFKALNGDAPDYIRSMFTFYNPPRTLRSSSKKYILKEERSKLKTMGNRAFAIAAPRHWNSLPDDLRDIQLNINDFKKKLKTFLFRMAYTSEQRSDYSHSE